MQKKPIVGTNVPDLSRSEKLRSSPSLRCCAKCKQFKPIKQFQRRLTLAQTRATLRQPNATTRYKLTDQLPQAIAREFITRTRYRVTSDAETADAVLDGTDMQLLSYNGNDGKIIRK